MSQRRGFCINAATMGLTTPNPHSAPPQEQQQQQQQQQEEQAVQAEQQRQPDVQQQVRNEHEQDKEEVKQKVETQTAKPLTTESKSITTLLASPSLRGGAEVASTSCRGPSPGQDQCQASSEPMSTEHYRSQLQKLRVMCGEDAMMNFELNSIFLKRLEGIDCIDQQCGGDSNITQQLRLVTFQDWVDLLLHVNYIIFGNMSAIEVEASEKIMNCFQSVRGEQQQALEENRKLRKDICAIIKLVQEAFHHNNWNTDEMCLETLTVNQLLGLQADQCRPESETEKVAKCMKSLASEVAAKHDEVCHLQAQMCALDEVVQTARQKIILKDKCIAQLNQQLMELQDCLSKMTQGSNARTRPGDNIEDFDNGDYTRCLFDGLNEKDQQASELLRMLNKELTEFIDLISKKDFEAMECRRKLLSCFFERINGDRAETQHKLDNLRNQLRALDCNLDQLDAPVACSTNLAEDDFDMQLVDALRRRLRAINECNRELNTRCQRLEAEHRVELMEMRCTYDAEHSINVKNCQALRQIADLLSKLRCADLSYEEIYTDASTNNPFCVAIVEMYEKLMELQNSEEREKQLLTAGIAEDCPHRQQLEHTLIHCRTQSELLQATRDNYLSIIEDFQRDLDELTEQVQQQEQQQQQQQEQQQHELISLELDQSYSQISTNELQLQNQRLICQIQSLQNMLIDREQQIGELRAKLSGYTDVNETNRLKDEISELKQNNSDQSQKVLEIASLLEAHEEERLKLCKHNEDLVSCIEEQSKQLRRVSREVQGQQEQLCQAEKQQEELKIERNLLREEVVALKEKDAASSGRERAMNEQLKSRKVELDKSRCLLREMQSHLKQEERQHKDTLDRLCQANEDIRMQMRAVACECKQMQLKLKQQTSVNDQQQQIIDSFRKWKDAQLRSDEAMRQCIKRAEDHIGLLLEENQRLCEEYRRLYSDNCLLEVEMRRVKNAVNSRFAGGGYEQSDGVVVRGQEMHDEMGNRVRLMANTTDRLAEQCKMLNDSVLELPRLQPGQRRVASNEHPPPPPPQVAPWQLKESPSTTSMG